MADAWSEAVDPIGTELPARRRHHLHPLTAVARATLLVADAWSPRPHRR